MFLCHFATCFCNLYRFYCSFCKADCTHKITFFLFVHSKLEECSISVINTKDTIEMTNCIFCIFEIIFFFSVICSKANCNFFCDIRMSTKTFSHSGHIISSANQSDFNTTFTKYNFFLAIFCFFFRFFYVRLIARYLIVTEKFFWILFFTIFRSVYDTEHSDIIEKFYTLS